MASESCIFHMLVHTCHSNLLGRLEPYRIPDNVMQASSGNPTKHLGREKWWWAEFEYNVYFKENLDFSMFIGGTLILL